MMGGIVIEANTDFYRYSICHLPSATCRRMDIFKCIGISKIGLTENIEKRIIIIRGGISHTNACVGGVGNGSNERLCCPSG